MLAGLVPILLMAAPLNVASTDWAFSGIDKTLASALEGRFLKLLNDRKIQVVSSKDVAATLGLERQRQLVGCSAESSSCLAELAGALGVSALLSATVARAGSNFVVSLRVTSASDAPLPSSSPQCPTAVGSPS